MNDLEIKQGQLNTQQPTETGSQQVQKKNPDSKPTIFVGMTEAQAKEQGLLDQFNKANTDGDGTISDKEYASYINNQNKERYKELLKGEYVISNPSGYTKTINVKEVNVCCEGFSSLMMKPELLKKPLSYWLPVFNPVEYAEINPDVVAKVGNKDEKLLHHFIEYGMNEGRRANYIFDIEVYMRYNRDVVEKWNGKRRECYIHYIENGRKEGRRAN